MAMTKRSGKAARMNGTVRDARLGAEDWAFLADYDIGKYERPSVTADVVALTLRSVATGDWRAP